MTTKAEIKFVGDSTSAVTAVKRLRTEMGELQSIAAKSLGSFGGLLAGGAAVAGLVTITKRAVDAGDAFAKMSQKTGLAVEDLSKLQYAAGLSGVETEALQKGLVSLSAATVEAAEGTGIAGEAITKLGVKVKNADGSMRSSLDILYDLADQFQAMPDGVEKTNFAVDIFGKRLGADMIPLLNSGSAGLREMGDEAERLGIVMSTELAKKSEEFNDNLERMSKLSESAGKGIANSLIPSLNSILEQIVKLQTSGAGVLGWLFVSGDDIKNADGRIKELEAKIVSLRNTRDDLLKPSLANDINNFLFGDVEDIDRQISLLEKELKYLSSFSSKTVESATQTAAKREAIERQLQAKLAEIAKLRAIAEGKVSAEILDKDDKRVAAQIKNAEKVRDALLAAWKSAAKDAEAAGVAAAKLFDDAANTRASGADRAAAKRRSALTPEQQQAEIQSEFDSAASAASNAAAQAQYAAMFGRTENAAKLAKEAERAAEKAARLADQIDDPEMGARAIEQAAEIQAQLQEAQARQKQAEQLEYQKQAETTAAQVAQLDQMITELQTKAAALKVEADITAAQGQLAALQAQLDNLKDKTITVTVQQVNTGGAPLGGTDQGTPISGGASGSFARGGWTGPGGKYQPAGIVHADEWVVIKERVQERGAKEFLARFNQYGMAALNLPGYANGGLVGNIRIPSIAPRAANAMTPVVFNLPGIGQAVAQMERSAADSFGAQMQRAALKRGGKR